MLGSGQEGGFGLRPSQTRQGLFIGFEDEASARQFVDHSSTLQEYRAHARELCVATLRATSSKGQWSESSFETTSTAPAGGPIAALTRASIRPRHALAFWRMAPAAETALGSVPGCLLAVGLGEAPLLRQATFSIWSSTSAMDAYARSGAHMDAIRASYTRGFFSESMFVRFVVLQLQGVWKGVRYGV
jgi:spheroidene monooxygenase